MRSDVSGALRNEMELFLALTEAQSWLDQDLPERATTLIDGVRSLANPAEIEQLIEVEALALASASERATQARRRGDIPAAARAVADAEQSAATLRAMEAPAARDDSPPISWFARGRLLLVDGERQRARGHVDPACWRIALESADRVGMRGAASYARMRLVEAMMDAGTSASEVTEALDTADVGAAEHGDAATIDRLVILRARLPGPPAAGAPSS